MTGWTAAAIPPLRGRTAIVTGATSGIGKAAARVLAEAGATVIVAGRNTAKGASAVAEIRAELPAANVRFALVDLGSLASIRAFASRLHAECAAVDILINNAGLMMIPARQETEDGFERQFGTNHLGHFALAAVLWPLLAASGGARVVTVSSVAHHRGRLDFADLNQTRHYRPLAAYDQSKLANLMFALELQRRSDAAGASVISVAAHPGHVATDLYLSGQNTLAGQSRGGSLRVRIGDAVFRAIGQSSATGALPLLYAATGGGIVGGGYYGPTGFREWYGPPGPARIARRALDRDAAARLWEASEAMTGIRFDPAVELS